MHSNQYTFIDMFDEFDWKMMFQNYHLNQREMDRFNNPKVYEGPTDEEVEMEMEWRNSRGE